MTVTLIGEDPAGRTGTNNKGVRTYTRVFKLEASDRNDGPYAVGSASGLPLIGSLHNEDLTAWCVSLTPTNNNPWKGWIVTAEYSSAVETFENPHQDPAEISWSTEQYQVVASKDRLGRAILNSAGDYFSDPPPMRDESRRIVTIEKNMSFVPTWILDTENAVNSAAFVVDGFAVAAGLAKIQRVSVGKKEYRNNTMFRRVTIEMHLQKNGWDLEILDAGMRQRNDDGKLEKILSEADSSDVTTPVPLDGTGKVLNDPTPTSAVYGSYNVYPTFDFANLPLT